MKNKILMFFTFFIPLSAVLYLVYSPTLLVSYGYHEDFSFWRVPRNVVHPFVPWTLSLGRPGFAFLYSCSRYFIEKIGDLQYLRAFSFFCMISSAWLFSLWLWNRLRFDRTTSFLASVCVFTLPTTQVLIGYATCFTITAAILAALIGFLLLEKAQLDMFGIKGKIIFSALGVMLILISCFTYSAAAMFPAALFIGHLLFDDKTEWIKKKKFIIKNIIVFALTLLAYFVITKWVLFPIYVSKDPHWVDNVFATYRFQLTSDIKGKIPYFVNELSLRVFNLWRTLEQGDHSPVSVSAAAGVLGFILFCFGVKLFYDFNKVRSGLLKMRQIALFYCEKIFLLGGLILLANAPNLLAVGGVTVYRAVFAYATIVILLLIWSFQQFVALFNIKYQKNLFIFLLSVLALIGMFTSQSNILRSYALNSSLELSFLRAALVPHIFADDITTVHVIRPRLIGNKNYVGLPSIFDEMGTPAAIFPENIPNMVSAIYLEYGKETRDKIMVSSSDDREKFSIIGDPAKTVVINMNDLLPSAEAIRGAEATITASSSSYESVSGILLGNTIWHAQTPPQYPEWVEISYPKPQIVRILKMKAQPNVEKRAPKDFILQASHDGKVWMNLLRVKDNIHRDGKKWHEWEFNNDKSFRYYRLYIIANGGDPNYLTIQQLALEATMITCSSSSHESVNGILSGETIWHARIPPRYPEWVEITYPNPRVIDILKMKPQPNVEKRTPKDFIFQASNNHRAWIDLLHVKGNVSQHGKDWHEWKFNNKNPYRSYRLYIMSNGGDPDYLTIDQIKLE